jgi:Zn finger protein HypA/HybF involved in hydrogenase expression
MTTLEMETTTTDVYLPCCKCREETHVNALDNDGKCPTCRSGENINEERMET